MQDQETEQKSFVSAEIVEHHEDSPEQNVSSTTDATEIVVPRENDKPAPTVPEQQKTTHRPHIVIVGGGFGGLQAAKSLKDAPVRITLIDRNNHHLFQPLLYWVATAGLSPADISSPIRRVLRHQKNVDVQMDEVTGVDSENRLVLLGERTLSYDYLILATGAQDNYFGHPEWSAYAPGLKSIREATAIRSHILRAFEKAEIETDPERVKELLTFVLVGAGPTGVEMAGAIAELAHKALASDFRHIDPAAARVILLEGSPRILPPFPERLSRKASMALKRLGVEIRVNAMVEHIDAEGVIVGGQRIASQNIIWSAGVAASSAGQWLGTEVDRGGRVRVSEHLAVIGHPNIFVIGDTATLNQRGKPLPGVASVAMQQGRYVGSLLKQYLTAGDMAKPFHYVDKGSLATVGRAYAVINLKGLQLTGLLAWVLWLVIHVYYLIDFRNRLVTLFQWAWTYVTFSRGARLITTDDSQRE